MQYQEESLFRKYAYEQGVNINTYTALEIEIRELLKSSGHKGNQILVKFVNCSLKKLINCRRKRFV